jgi:hypothetical protein
MNNEFNIPGFNVYIVEIGEKLSIQIKPIDKSGPLISLREDGKWVDPLTRSFFKIDSDGALWIQSAKKGTDISSFVPDDNRYIPKNHLATLKYNATRRKLKKIEKRHNKKKGTAN